jgi:hypothetical protein
MTSSQENRDWVWLRLVESGMAGEVEEEAVLLFRARLEMEEL